MGDLIDREAVLPILAGLARTQGEYDESYDKLMRITPANRWISVHDMLPMEGMDVLICNTNEWCKIASYHGNHWEDDSGKCIPEYEITHWQELPEPPKGGAEDE